MDVMKIIGTILGTIFIFYLILYVISLVYCLCNACNSQSQNNEGNPNAFRRTVSSKPLVSPSPSAMNYQFFNETARTHSHNDEDEAGAVASTDQDAKKM